MQLNEILEANSLKEISKKTNISKENIEALAAAEFDALKRVKTLGFISIIEREYRVDLSAFREQALSYYAEHRSDEESITLGYPAVEEKRGKSKWFLLLVLGLLIYASWYFFTQFDQKHLSTLLPFSEEKVLNEIITPKEESLEGDLSIANVTVQSEPVSVDSNDTVVADSKVKPEATTKEESKIKENQTNTTIDVSSDTKEHF
jgi:cytoskeletal protein RodZ